jgi:hypothetical protein
MHGLKSMLDLYGVGGDEWTELIELAVTTRRLGWWRTYGIGDNSYVGLEAEAARVQVFTLAYMPGLLQVAPYSEALFLASPLVRSTNALEREVAVRMKRQQRLTAVEDDLELVALVAEAALHVPVGGRAVLREQLDHLLMASDLDNVTLQVLPHRSGRPRRTRLRLQRAELRRHRRTRRRLRRTRPRRRPTGEGRGRLDG